MRLANALRPKAITRIDGTAGISLVDDLLAVEEPLEIRVDGHSIAVLMRTPGHDRELAAGFLVTEGIVRERDDVLDLIFCGAGSTPSAQEAPIAFDSSGPVAQGEGSRENVIDVLLAPGARVDLTRLTRHVFTSSSCGICSKTTIEAVRLQFAPLVSILSPRWEVLVGLPDRLRAAQVAFAATGGLHASALFDRDGALELIREDVGRHNALDKVIGHAFLAERLPLAGRILLVSGRVSFELMQKALAGGISCVAAISAPTTAAVDFAEASGQTLVGFLRGSRMNVYAGTLAK